MVFSKSLRNLLSLTLIITVFSHEDLRAIQPQALANLYPPNGIIPESPALFGIPPYGRTITARVIWATPGDFDGCTPIRKELNPEWPPAGTSLILMVDRGECSFVVKVRNAQNAGALAAIVVDNNPEPILPYMADDGTGAGILIPSVLIHQDDGANIKQQIMANETVVVAMRWDLPNPDNVVEWVLWTSSNDPQAITFKSVFGDAVKSLGSAATFTPNYFILEGGPPGCMEPGLPCGNECTNEGRYCAVDPEHDVTRGLSGADIITENLRQMCLFQTLNATGRPEKWWDYVSQFNTLCAPSLATWTEACSFGILDTLGIPSSAITTCISTSGGLQTGNNSLLAAAVYKRYVDGIFYLPTVYVNTQAYRGSINCPQPLSIQTCGVLEAICAGYPQDSKPCACLSSPGCQLCEYRDACGVCGGDGTLDVCNQCLSPANANFNQTCTGCDGVPNSGKKYDACGVCAGQGSLDKCQRCLQPGDPIRIDEGGFDACGVCLKYNDPRYNKSCLGCDGVPNSNTQRDACGACGGTAKPGDRCGGLSSAAIAVIIIVCVSVTFLILLFVVRRQQQKMRTEFNDVLRRYQPLQGQPEATHGLISSNQDNNRDDIDQENSMTGINLSPLPRNVTTHEHDDDDTDTR